MKFCIIAHILFDFLKNWCEKYWDDVTTHPDNEPCFPTLIINK